MSNESARYFLKRMKSDEDFAKKITACKDAEERNAVARDAGYEFTPVELKIGQMLVDMEEMEGLEEDWERIRTGCFYDRGDDDDEEESLCAGIYIPH